MFEEAGRGSFKAVGLGPLEVRLGTLKEMEFHERWSYISLDGVTVVTVSDVTRGGVTSANLNVTLLPGM